MSTILSIVWQRVQGIINQSPTIVDIRNPEEEIHLLGGTVQISFDGNPIQVILGKQRQGPKLLIYPEGVTQNTNDYRPPSSHLIFDPTCYGSEISGTLRLSKGDAVVIGRDDPEQQNFFSFTNTVSKKHLKISRVGDNFIFKDLSKEVGVYISTWKGLEPSLDFKRLRKEKTVRLLEYFGGPIQILDHTDAIEAIQQVNTLLEQDSFQPKNDQGQPGGVVILPDSMVPIVVGDLHGQVDNLFKILIENAFLEGLESGEAFLLFLGDLVHSEEEGEMEHMKTSLLMMDLVFKLKIRFPRQVFFLRGNHDSFAEEVAKGGISQGLLWEREILRSRGQQYKEEMDRFYATIPYVALGSQFLACHAAPPRGGVTLDMLVNIYKYPGLSNELIWNRLLRPGYPSGYVRSDVVRFRKSLKTPPETPFIVGHTPLSRDFPFWLNVGDIKNHHIVFSGLIETIGLFTCVKGGLVPQVYLAEPELTQDVDHQTG